MSARANSMHAFPIETTKHYFWDRSKEGQASDFGKLSKDIKSNFFKGGSTIEKIKLSAMNSARDISYAMMAANYIAVEQDFWLVTFDKGLHSFFQTAYLEPETLGAASNRFKAVEFEERLKHPYWETVDMLHLFHTSEREKAGISSFDQERINNCISETEQELENLI